MLAARLALWNPDSAWAEDLERRITPLADIPQRDIALKLLRVRAGRASADELAPTLLARAQHRRRAVRGAILWRQILAEVLMFAGQPDEALPSIEKAVDLGLLDISWLDRCPLLLPITPSERFQAARERVAERAKEVLAVLSTATPR